MRRRRNVMQTESGSSASLVVPCSLPCLNIVEGYPNTNGQTSLANTYTDLTYLSIEAGRNFAVLINGVKTGGSYNNATKRWAFYTANKTFISRGYKAQSSDNNTKTVPSNAAYIVVAVSHANALTVLPLMSVVYE